MKGLGSDQKMQQLLQNVDNLKIHLSCEAKNRVTHMCMNPTCKKSSLHCQIEQCDSCAVHQQEGCAVVSLKFLTKVFKNWSERKKIVLREIIDIEVKMMEQLQSSKKELEGMFGLSGLEDQQMQLLVSLFCKQTEKVDIKGNDAAKLIEKLQQNKKESSQRQREALEYFQKDVDKITLDLINLEKNLVNKVFQQKINLDSKIIPSTNLQALSFLITSLFNPKRFDLLFRASQNGYLAQQFHKKCDNIKHTLVIAKTQHGKIIAGYTPIQWQPQIKVDSQKKSCLLSVSLCQKMSLVNEKNPIYYFTNHGPGFGAGAWDLFISDKCNTSNNCVAKMPVCYDSGKFKDQVQPINPFTGSRCQDRFNIQQYEVYKLSW